MLLLQICYSKDSEVQGLKISSQFQLNHFTSLSLILHYLLCDYEEVILGRKYVNYKFPYYKTHTNKGSLTAMGYVCMCVSKVEQELDKGEQCKLL